MYAFPDTCIFDVVNTDKTFTKGTTIVSKLKLTFVLFDVNAAAFRFVVVMAFETYRLPVVMAFETYRLPVICTFEVGVVDAPTPTCGT